MSIPANFPVPLDAPRVPCSLPEYVALVDLAFERPGGEAAEQMKTDVCPGCPIGERCLAWAMTRRESGIWGGTGPNTRTRRGAPRKAS